MAISGAVIPVVLIKRHRLLAPGKSFLASINTASQIGALIKADGSAGMILIWWLSKDSAGKISAEFPRALVTRIKLVNLLS
jgi:hypothetical protein